MNKDTRKGYGYIFNLTLLLFILSFSSKKNDEVNISQDSSISNAQGNEYNNELNFENDDFFFKRQINSMRFSLDDILLTYNERGVALDDNMKEFQKYLTKEVCSQNYLDEKVLEKLNIRSLLELTLLDPIVTLNVNEHKNVSLYNKDKDSIYWDKLVDVLKINSDNEALRINSIYMSEKEEILLNGIKNDLKSDGNLEYNFLVQPVETLSMEDLKTWVAQLQFYVEQVKKTVPDFDMQKLACMLEDYVILYEREGLYNYLTYASNSDKKIVYTLMDGKKPNMKEFYQVNFHEFKHLISQPCPDEKNDTISITASGINVDMSFLVKYNIETKRASFFTHIPFKFTFIEEAEANCFLKQYLNLNPLGSSYFVEEFVLDNINLSLSLQKGFKDNSFMKYGILHNPIAFIQQFPIADGTYNEQRNWLISQLQMLEAYEITLDSLDLYLFAGDDCDLSYECLTVLENTADLQMYRNFLLNLSCYSLTNPNITEEDYFFLLHLFEYRMDLQRQLVADVQKVESIDTFKYLNKKEQLFSKFFKILGSDVDYIKNKYNAYDLSVGKLSDAFTEQQKEYYYNLYNVTFEELKKKNQVQYDTKRLYLNN